MHLSELRSVALVEYEYGVEVFYLFQSALSLAQRIELLDGCDDKLPVPVLQLRFQAA